MKRKILVVDDDPAAAELVQAILENDGGIHVLVGCDGEEALEISRREGTDVTRVVSKPVNRFNLQNIVNELSQ